MSVPGFLFDEHVPTAIVGALLSLEPSIHIEPVGQLGCPAKGTPDPELIEYAQRSGLVIVTHDKSTMPPHAYDQLAAGKHLAGVIIIANERPSPGQIANDLLIAWFATDEAYWRDRIEYIPL
jgi:hypothetical protein